MGKGTVHYGFGVKGGLRKEDQQFGEWLRANSVRGVRKSVKVIASASHTHKLCGGGSRVAKLLLAKVNLRRHLVNR